MHDAGVVVAEAKRSSLSFLKFLEGPLGSRDDVTLIDNDVIVPVKSAVLVVEANSMSDLMDNSGEEYTPWAKGDALGGELPNPSNVGSATAIETIQT